MKPVFYVVANKGLHMSPGKLAAQVAHATMGIAIKGITKFGIPDLQPWFTEPHRWVIILEGEDEMHLLNIQEYLRDRKVQTYAVIDEGVNEVRPFSITALGVQVLDKDSREAAYLSSLKKYSDNYRKFLEQQLHEERAKKVSMPTLKQAMDRLPMDYLSRKGRKRLLEL